MILIQSPAEDKTVQSLFRAMRRLAESRGVEFSNVALDVEVEASRVCAESMDVTGNLAHQNLAVFIGTVIAFTEYQTVEQGHDWLHVWLETAFGIRSCLDAKRMTVEFSKLLVCDDLTEIMRFARYVAGERLDVKRMAQMLGDGTVELLETARNALDASGRASFDQGIIQFCERAGELFSAYATKENGLEAVKTVAESTAKFLPLQALNTYMTNAFAAVNWGLVSNTLIAQLKNDQFVEETIQGLPAVDGNPDPGDTNEELFEAFRKLFE